MTTEQPEYRMEDCMLLKDALKTIIRSGADMSDQVLRYRAEKQMIKATKFGGRDWWILKSEVTKLCKEQAS